MEFSTTEMLMFSFQIAWVVCCVRHSFPRDKAQTKSELLSLPHMIDQQVTEPVVSHEMAVTEPACTKAQYNGKTNSSSVEDLILQVP